MSQLVFMILVFLVFKTFPGEPPCNVILYSFLHPLVWLLQIGVPIPRPHGSYRLESLYLDPNILLTELLIIYYIS